MQSSQQTENAPEVGSPDTTPISQRVKLGFFWNQIGGALDYGLFLVFAVVVARALGAVNFGLYATVLSYASLGMMVISLGMNRATHVSVAPLMQEKEKAAYLVRVFVKVRVLGGLLVAVVLFFGIPPITAAFGWSHVGTMLRWMGPYILGMGLTSLFLAYFSAKLELKWARLAKAFFQFLNLVGGVWIYLAGGGVREVLGVLTVTSLLTAVALGVLAKDIWRERVHRFSLRSIWSFCRSQTVMEIITFLLGKNADIILLNLLLVGTVEAGYYNVSAALTLAVSTLLISGAGDIGLSATSLIVQKNEPDLLQRAWRFRIKTGILLSVPLMVFAFGFAPVIVSTLLSESYLPATSIFRVAVGAQILVALMGGGAHADVLLSSGRHQVVRNLRVSAGVANVVLDLIFIPFWGGLGAAIATGIAAVGLVGMEFWTVRRVYPLALPVRSPVGMLVASGIAGIAVWWFPFSGWLLLVTSMLGFTVVFSFLSWLVKPYDSEDSPILLRAGKPFDRLLHFLSPTS